MLNIHAIQYYAEVSVLMIFTNNFVINERIKMAFGCL